MVLNVDNCPSPCRTSATLVGKLILCLRAGWEQLPAVLATASKVIVGLGVAAGVSKPSWPELASVYSIEQSLL